MEFRTKISKTEGGAHYIRGHDLTQLIKDRSFAEVVFLLLRGDFPETKEKELLESMLVATVENGIEAPSVFVPRVIVSTGNAFHTALAAGILSIGEKHGGAAESAAYVLQSKKTASEVVDEWEKVGKFIPGFGHQAYKDEDPRAAALYKKAKELGFGCSYFQLAYEIEAELEKKKTKKIPLNIDGALACSLLELGLDPRLGKALFLIARIVGMSAHVLEELEQGNKYHRLSEKDIHNKT